MSAASARQIGVIHAIAKSCGIDDGARRALMADEAGKISASLLTADEAERVIERLKAVQATLKPASDRLPMDGPFAAKLRALWISGWHLGVVRDRSDRALLAFVERQTGVSHTRFLREPREAARAVEALKAWLTRDGGVHWPPSYADAIAVKRAVVYAIATRLHAVGEDGPGPISHCSARQLDHAAETYGSKLRRALARAGTEAKR